jgi:hypothetical protein
MFLPLLVPTLLAIGLSILAWRFVLGYLAKPGRRMGGMRRMRLMGRMGLMRRMGRFLAWTVSAIERRGK